MELGNCVEHSYYVINQLINADFERYNLYMLQFDGAIIHIGLNIFRNSEKGRSG